MKTITAFLIIAFTALFFSSFAQETNSNEEPFIEVTGMAEMEIMSDEIYISITLKDRQEASHSEGKLNSSIYVKFGIQ